MLKSISDPLSMFSIHFRFMCFWDSPDSVSDVRSIMFDVVMFLCGRLAIWSPVKQPASKTGSKAPPREDTPSVCEGRLPMGFLFFVVFIGWFVCLFSGVHDPSVVRETPSLRDGVRSYLQLCLCAL